MDIETPNSRSPVPPPGRRPSLQRGSVSSESPSPPPASSTSFSSPKEKRKKKKQVNACVAEETARRGEVCSEEGDKFTEIASEVVMERRIVNYSERLTQNTKAPPKASPREDVPPKQRFIKTATFLGRGAFGMVYESYDTETSRFVATKEVQCPVGAGQANPFIDKVTTEIRTLKLLHHPHIVSYIAAERVGNSVCIHVELVSGGSITSVLKQLNQPVEGTILPTRGFGEQNVRVYTRQLCRGLEYLHSLNIAHRDIKGENVLIDKSGGKVKLADFNSCRQRLGGSIESMKTIAGTLWYMSPEMISGKEYGLASDIWSVGITVIEMLTGVPPLSGQFNSSPDAMFHIASLQDPYCLPEGVGDASAAFLHSCLLKNPQDRLQIGQLCKHQFVSESGAAGGLIRGDDEGSAKRPIKSTPLEPVRCGSPEILCRKQMQNTALPSGGGGGGGGGGGLNTSKGYQSLAGSVMGRSLVCESMSLGGEGGGGGGGGGGLVSRPTTKILPSLPTKRFHGKMQPLDI